MTFEKIIEAIPDKPYYLDETSEIAIYCADCRLVLPYISDKSIDLVLTDPPYETMLKWEGIGTTARMGMGKKGTSADAPSKFFKVIRNSELPFFLKEFYRILEMKRHCYVMCDDDTLPYIFQCLGKGWHCPEGCLHWYGEEDEPFTKFTNLKLLIWDKELLGMGYHYRCQYEFIIMLDKGKNRRLKDLTKPDVLRFKRYNGEVPTEKPMRLFELLIYQSSNESEIIIDPFLGSGTTLACAKRLGRKGIGIEIEERYCRIAKDRLAQPSMRLEI